MIDFSERRNSFVGWIGNVGEGLERSRRPKERDGAYLLVKTLRHLHARL